MTPNPVNWFEIPVTNIERATKFYETVFNIKLGPMAMGPLTLAMFPWKEGGEGAAGALVKAESYIPSYSGSMVYFSVDDMEGTLARVTASGGKVIRGKMNIGEYGFVGHFEDSEGNRVALHSVS